MRNIFKMLKSKKIHIYSDTEEYKFFAKNSQLLHKYLSFYKLRSFDDISFKIIQANIIIKAIMNKKLIEENINSIDIDNINNEVKEILDNNLAPYFELEGSKIYIPIYSRGLNYIYVDEPVKLLSYPYVELKDEPISNCIDLFDEYNIRLYDSDFSNLIKIGTDKTSAAFYHIEFETIYIINNQGRLDVAIRLFDNGLKEHNYDDLEERLIDVVNNFYSNERKNFIKSLYMNKFISLKCYKKLSKNISLRNIKKDRLVRKVMKDEVL